ncbi:DNA alkylation repair protein [Bacillus sp. RG28]|uniref:DNA alkylation repair protein n=1 Tax=Gottfriedia endophytica TaxID=2820819 RepID=A0A940NKI6_9BACI|nr:DNA alkylation repair protein [Gottfriedia endophytica]MBP0725892.1 DNA alkylation repair protein [Gottfriedia endophytica]
MHKLVCPRCKTNKSRFYLIEQHPKAIKLDPQNGNVEKEEYLTSGLDPFFVPYKGPDYLVQCGTCGLIDKSILFEKAAER